MSRFWLGSAALAGLLLTGTVGPSWSSPPGDGGSGDSNGAPPPRPRFELGRVLPPPIAEELELTREQRDEIARLEKEVKERLARILTAEQRQKAETFRPGAPGGPGDGDRVGRSNQPDQEEGKNAGAGIQWYATWQSGLREAQRTGRPILLVSAAPHCAGVSGIW